MLLIWALAAAAHAAGPDDVDYRQNVMKTLGAQASALQLVLQNQAPADHLLIHVRALRAASGQIADAFRPPAEGGHSRAKIWRDWDDFAEVADSQVRQLEVLERALEAGDAGPEDVADALACQQCHESYRGEIEVDRTPVVDRSDDAPPVVDYRRYLMQAMDGQTAALGQILSWVIADDHFVSHLDVVARNAEIALDSFEEPVQGGEALPVIWERWDDYSAKMRAFADAVANAAEVARTQGKDAALEPVMDALSCKQCHDDYRRE